MAPAGQRIIGTQSQNGYGLLLLLFLLLLMPLLLLLHSRDGLRARAQLRDTWLPKLSHGFTVSSMCEYHSAVVVNFRFVRRCA